MSKRFQTNDTLVSPTIEQHGLYAVGLKKIYKKRCVVQKVDVYIQRGEVVGLLGPNGAGKTTCFSIIAGMVTPDQGHIYLDGHDISHFAMYQRARLGIGYLPQEASIFRGLNVEDNIRAVLEITSLTRDQREDKLDQLLSEFMITHLRRSPSLTLSGGERRRVEIARALATDPHFIMLDEPLAGIDPKAVHDIRELIYHLKDRKIGILVTDHNVREMLDIVDRAYIINEGCVLKEGSPSEIISDKAVRHVYLGEHF